MILDAAETAREKGMAKEQLVQEKQAVNTNKVLLVRTIGGFRSLSIVVLNAEYTS